MIDVARAGRASIDQERVATKIVWQLDELASRFNATLPHRLQEPSLLPAIVTCLTCLTHAGIAADELKPSAWQKAPYRLWEVSRYYLTTDVLLARAEPDQLIALEQAVEQAVARAVHVLMDSSDSDS